MAEPSSVTGLGLGILVFEAIIFCGTAPRGPMMQRAPEDVPAEFLPIGPCVHEVQVPGLIDFIRGRDGVPRTKSQKQEASIFIHHTSCEFGRPVVFPCETPGEGQRVLMVEGEVLELEPQRIVRRVHGGQGERDTKAGKPCL